MNLFLKNFFYEINGKFVMFCNSIKKYKQNGFLVKLLPCYLKILIIHKEQFAEKFIYRYSLSAECLRQMQVNTRKTILKNVFNKNWLK